jgi:hypothetical protein
VAECIDTGEIPERFGVAAAGAVVGSEHDMDAQVAAVQREIMENGPVQARSVLRRAPPRATR